MAVAIALTCHGDCHDCRCHDHIFVLPFLSGIALAVIEFSHERGQEYGVSEAEQALFNPNPNPTPLP